MYTECYNCGQEGHRRSECPSRSKAPAPAPGLTPAPSNRPEDKPVPEPVPASQRARYDTVSPHAEALRAKMGWTMSAAAARELDSRAAAAEQVAETRASRSVLP